jgi:hypothetical protein
MCIYIFDEAAICLNSSFNNILKQYFTEVQYFCHSKKYTLLLSDIKSLLIFVNCTIICVDWLELTTLCMQHYKIGVQQFNFTD